MAPLGSWFTIGLDTVGFFVGLRSREAGVGCRTRGNTRYVRAMCPFATAPSVCVGRNYSAKKM